MPDYLSSLNELDWVAVQAIAISVSSLILVATAIIGVRQLRQSAKSLQFDAVLRMGELVDDFREDRAKLFENLPLELAFTGDQFALKPPTHRKQPDHTYAERRRMLLTPEQTEAMASMTDNDLKTARLVITRFNNLGQLIEDGYFPKRTFYLKHHVMVLRTCHMVEPIRRQLEDEKEGGNYGRKLLTMRATAAKYFDRTLKHREGPPFTSAIAMGADSYTRQNPVHPRGLGGRWHALFESTEDLRAKRSHAFVGRRGAARRNSMGGGSQ